jgi:hypothetical protein
VHCSVSSQLKYTSEESECQLPENTEAVYPLEGMNYEKAKDYGEIGPTR